MPIYLDYAATTPVHPEVYDAMKPYWMEEFGNPASRTHVYGQRANEATEKARMQVALAIDVKPREIIFTSGATESNNLAILGLAKHPANKDKKHIISSPIEHKSVLEPLEYLAAQGYEIDLVPMDHSGRVKVKDVVDRVRHDTLLISIMHVNNETGVIQPIDEICNAIKNDHVYIHTDAAQGYGKELTVLKNPRLDLVSISGHKIFGPKGVGALKVKNTTGRKVELHPLVFGGGQERGLRAGTIATPLVVGLGHAAEWFSRNAETYTKHCLDIKKELMTTFESLNIQLLGNQDHNLPNILCVALDDIDSEALMICTKNLIAISNGSACTSKDYTESHVLKAMGFPKNVTENTLRLSWNHDTQMSWLAEFKSTLRDLAQ